MPVKRACSFVGSRGAWPFSSHRQPYFGARLGSIHSQSGPRVGSEPVVRPRSQPHEGVVGLRVRVQLLPLVGKSIAFRRLLENRSQRVFRQDSERTRNSSNRPPAQQLSALDHKLDSWPSRSPRRDAFLLLKTARASEPGKPCKKRGIP